MQRLFQIYEKSGMARKDLEEMAKNGRESEADPLPETLPRDEFPESLDCGEKRDAIIRAMQERMAENEKNRTAVTETKPLRYRRLTARYLTACACVLMFVAAGISLCTYTLHGNASPGRHGMEIQQTDGDIVIGVAQAASANEIEVGNVPEGYRCVLEERGHKAFQKGEECFDVYWDGAINDQVQVQFDEKSCTRLPEDPNNPVWYLSVGETHYMTYVKDGSLSLLLISSDLTEEEMTAVISSISAIED